MKKIICLMGILMLPLGIINSAAEANNISAEEAVNAQTMYSAAYKDYVTAKTTEDANERNTLYTKVIGDINQAIQWDSSNSTYLMLASQAYRSKGGNAYAKQYFLRAEQSMLERLEQNPKSIKYNLEYAIACYAGDVRFWSTYADYNAKAKEYAEKVLALCVEEEPIDSSENLLYMAMANLILEQDDWCENLLLLAKENADKSIGADSSAAVVYADLYESTVAQKHWLWNVQEKSVAKEFLLYYLADMTNSDRI